MKNNVICDNKECKKEFEIELKTRALTKNVNQIYFDCPHCGSEYNVTKTNAQIEGVQSKIDYYSKRLSETKDKVKRENLLKYMDELIKKKKELHEVLNLG